jgi:enamine deaminase RidA (YjgF/YER057c/UK114 family)
LTVQRLPSGGPWEERIGYSRVVRVGPWILTAGCTSTVDGTVAHVGDAYRQAAQAFRIALDAVEQAGATVADVVRTRMYVVRVEDCDAVGRAHRDVFGEVRPVATMVVVDRLISPEQLVEVEVEAYRP